MKQHAAAVSFPAAALAMILTWILSLVGVDVPAEISPAFAAIFAWAAVEFGLSRDQPPVDPVTSEQQGPPGGRRPRRRDGTRLWRGRQGR